MLDATEGDVARAWSIAFILYHCGGHIDVGRIRALYRCLDETLLQRALRTGQALGVIHTHEEKTYWHEATRAKEILLWHDWADIGLTSEDPREPVYDALLTALVKGAPEAEALKDELRALPSPDASFRLKHRTPHSHCLVYFIQMGDPEDEGPIKIGFSRGLQGRLRTIQDYNPFELHVLHSAPGDRVEEALLHTRFAEARVRKEWFRPIPELLDLIARKPLNLYAEGTDRQGWTPRPIDMQVFPPQPRGSVEAYLSGVLRRFMRR